ncbi:hypothetical protein IIA94_02175 [Patescibacteria group bacterium]|nr:hypothetical protein [Patescibacteria group bacterium]
MKKDTIVISKEEVKERGGVVILDLKEYQELCERAVPTYYLAEKEAEELDELVREGLRDYRAGKTKKIKSLSDLD